MADAHERKHSKFSAEWYPVITIVILAGFGLQALTPYLDPMMTFGFCLSGGTAFGLAYDAEVLGKKGKLRTALLIATSTVAAGITLICWWQLERTFAELEQPCAKLRAELLRAPNDASAATYEALHCPVRFPRKK